MQINDIEVIETPKKLLSSKKKKELISTPSKMSMPSSSQRIEVIKLIDLTDD